MHKMYKKAQTSFECYHVSTMLLLYLPPFYLLKIKNVRRTSVKTSVMQENMYFLSTLSAEVSYPWTEVGLYCAHCAFTITVITRF